MRAIKSSLEQLLKRIEFEARAAIERENRQRVSELRKLYAADIIAYHDARERLDRIEERLEKAGLSMHGESMPTLARKHADEIETKHINHRHRFHVMRNNIVIRLGLADDGEKKFMLRNFFDEVAKVYPALQSILGKIDPASPTYLGKIKK
jgi:hypothetical protein